MKREQIRLNLPYPEAQFVVEMAEATNLAMADICLTLLLPAIRSAQAQGKTLTLPIQFAVVTPQNANYHLNEKTTPAPVARARAASPRG